MASRVRTGISVMGYWNAKESNDNFKHRYFRFAFAFVSYRASSIAIILRLVEMCLRRTDMENCTWYAQLCQALARFDFQSRIAKAHLM
jgi:hypothetical protein